MDVDPHQTKTNLLVTLVHRVMQQLVLVLLASAQDGAPAQDVHGWIAAHYRVSNSMLVGRAAQSMTCTRIDG